MPKFDEIAKLIEKRIKDKVYSSSQKLPSEYQFAKEFNASRLTVRKAIQSLIEKQVLVKDPGKGTYVMAGLNKEKIQSGIGGLQSFTEVAKAHGKTAHTKVLEYHLLTNPSVDVMKALKLEDRLNQKVHYLKRIRFWDEMPLTVEEIIIGDGYVQGLHKADFSRSLFSIIEKTTKIAYSRQQIEAVLVTDELAKLLKVKENDPLLKERSITYSADGKPIFLDNSYYRADKYSFDSTLTRLQ